MSDKPHLAGDRGRGVVHEDLRLSTLIQGTSGFKGSGGFQAGIEDHAVGELDTYLRAIAPILVERDCTHNFSRKLSTFHHNVS